MRNLEHYGVVMTCKELIELLQSQPEDLPVVITYDSNCGAEGIRGLLEVKDGILFLDTTGN